MSNKKTSLEYVKIEGFREFRTKVKSFFMAACEVRMFGLISPFDLLCAADSLDLERLLWNTRFLSRRATCTQNQWYLKKVKTCTFFLYFPSFTVIQTVPPVSYTHLDVYKRQL